VALFFGLSRKTKKREDDTPYCTATKAQGRRWLEKRYPCHYCHKALRCKGFGEWRFLSITPLTPAKTPFSPAKNTLAGWLSLLKPVKIQKQ